MAAAAADVVVVVAGEEDGNPCSHLRGTRPPPHVDPATHALLPAPHRFHLDSADARDPFDPTLVADVSSRAAAVVDSVDDLNSVADADADADADVDSPDVVKAAALVLDHDPRAQTCLPTPPTQALSPYSKRKAGAR